MTGGGLAIVGVGALVVLAVVINAIRFSLAPVERMVLVVIDKRTDVSGGGDDSSATTSYFATLKGRDGKRSEHKATADVAGPMAAGDIGVALLRMNLLVAFHRS